MNPVGLSELFGQALLKHRSLIKAAKAGAGVGPHIAAIRSLLSSSEEDDAPVKSALQRFQVPDVVFTGGDLSKNILGSVGNVYGRDQLRITYGAGEGSVAVIGQGKGKYCKVSKGLVAAVESAMAVMSRVAVPVALQRQMGIAIGRGAAVSVAGPGLQFNRNLEFKA